MACQGISGIDYKKEFIAKNLKLIFFIGLCDYINYYSKKKIYSLPTSIIELVKILPLSEDEKSLIHAGKHDIFALTDEIFDLLPNCKIHKNDILNRMSKIFFILRDLTSISNNLILEPQLTTLRNDFLFIHTMFEQDERQKIIQKRIENFCVDANSVILREK
jgi:hypothetical protein